MFYLKELETNNIIKFDDSKTTLSCTLLGNSMAKRFIKLKSLKKLNSLNFLKITETSDLLKILSKTLTVDQMAFKSGDKVLLHKISTHPQLIFPIAGKVDWETWKKPFLLVQVALQLELSEIEAKLTPAQRSDQQGCIEHFCRHLKCNLEYKSLKVYNNILYFISLVIADVADVNNQAILLRNALELISSLKGRSWHSNAKFFQQLQGIGQVSARSLFNAGIRSIDALRDTEDCRIEILLKRNPPFGRNLKRQINEQFPKIDLDCGLNLLGSKKLNVRLHCSNTETEVTYVHLLVIVYKSESSGTILLYNQIPLSILPLTQSIDIPTNENYKSFSCSLMYEEYSGLNQNICFDIQSSNKEESTLPESDKRVEYEHELDDFDLSDIDLEDINEEIQYGIPKVITPLKTEIIKNASTNSFSNCNTSNVVPSYFVPLSPSSSFTPSRCKHTCKDKFNCAHLCCKAGQLKRPQSHLSVATSPSPLKKQPVTFLAGARRSLTNAREYLQKYQPINTGTVKAVKSIPSIKTDDLYDEIELVLR